jgi:hypothetical protein
MNKEASAVGEFDKPIKGSTTLLVTSLTSGDVSNSDAEPAISSCVLRNNSGHQFG